jgi:hypothetical protein
VQYIPTMKVRCLAFEEMVVLVYWVKVTTWVATWLATIFSIP